MSYILHFTNIEETDKAIVGGKAFSLASLAKNGFTIPDTFCVTTHAYDDYVDSTGLRERILLELHRKEFSQMRWEEVWDASLRIRNLFLNKGLPETITSDLTNTLGDCFDNRPAVVRSSAPDEDAPGSSFAGLHESYVNIRGIDGILDAIRKVWASLWSDAALLYRQELGLDVEKSAMAVVIQEIIVGDRSGIAFSKNPINESEAVVESVYGLNEGLVDGAIEPDRWILDRSAKKIISHTPAERDQYVVPDEKGTKKVPVPERISERPPLTDRETLDVLETVLRAELFYDSPQDMEWTIRKDALYLLQSRPITTVATGNPQDKRKWYLSLHRSFENLRELRDKIEGEYIPGMIEAADALAEQDLPPLSDAALADEIRRRSNINNDWVNVYWSDFIPFAHGIRLFGQYYNDAIRPDNPYEFMDLLGATQMASLERNHLLTEMASMIGKNQELREQLEARDLSNLDDTFSKTLDLFIEKFGDLSCPIVGGTQCSQGPEALVKILLEMSAHATENENLPKRKDYSELKSTFLNRFENEKRTEAEEILDLARTSYQLRDDDNIYLGRVEAQMTAAVNEGKGRLRDRCDGNLDAMDTEEIIKGLKDSAYIPKESVVTERKPIPESRMKVRQLTGQPAGPGISRGKARVIVNDTDLSEFKYGEVLICDAVDPNMTFVVPLAKAIVERRGGMLIHGAIIAREYGLPCVTGIPDATTLIQTGYDVTVDGYLGIVTIGETNVAIDGVDRS